MSSSPDTLLRKLQEAEVFFTNTQYGHVVKEAARYLQRGEEGLCLVQLGRLPSAKALLAELVEKLKGKSVHKTLERAKRNGEDKVLAALAVSSLMTHAILEIKQGQLEYRLLLNTMLSEINNRVFALLGDTDAHF